MIEQVEALIEGLIIERRKYEVRQKMGKVRFLLRNDNYHFPNTKTKKYSYALLVDDELKTKMVVRNRQGYKIKTKLSTDIFVYAPDNLKLLFFSQDKETAVLARGIIDELYKEQYRKESLKKY